MGGQNTSCQLEAEQGLEAGSAQGGAITKQCPPLQRLNTGHRAQYGAAGEIMKRSNIPLGVTEAVKIAFKGGKSQEIQRKFAQNLKLTENV